jgi:hypothetical protein
MSFKHEFLSLGIANHHEGYSGVGKYYDKLFKSALMYRKILVRYPDRITFKIKILFLLSLIVKKVPLSKSILVSLKSVLIFLLNRLDSFRLPGINFLYRPLVLIALCMGLLRSGDDESSFY